MIQGKTTRFEGSALGTTVHKDIHKKIRLWAGVLFDTHGVSYMVGLTSTHVSDEAAQEMPAADAALRVLGGEYLRQPDGDYRH